MFGELPKLLGKNFAIGFFVPAVIMLSAIGLISERFDIFPDASIKSPSQDMYVVSFFVLLSWMLAIVFMSLNKVIIKIFEGYFALNPLRLLIYFQSKEYNELNSDLTKLMNKLDQYQGDAPSDLVNLYVRRRAYLVSNFPDRNQWILPTRLGNTIRAFEVYPRIIYGIDSVPIWSRLAAVTSPEYKVFLNDSKAQFDFWINMLTGLIVATVYYLSIALYERDWFSLWQPILMSLLVPVVYNFSVIAAQEWGAYVTGAFDLFREDLCGKMGYQIPRTIDEERKLWTAISQMIIYRSRDSADTLSAFRREG